MKLEYIVKDNKYNSIKEILKLHFHMSERFILKLKKNNRFYINNSPTFMYSTIKTGDILTIDISFEEKSENIIPAKMNLDIVFEDEFLIIINKPAGMPVHPSMAHFENSLSNGVQNYFEIQKIKTKIRPVNRLDKDTSGIVIFAKSEYIQECLVKQMANHTFKKYYLAILSGNLDKKSGTISAPIARKPESIIEREISKNGQNAITHFSLIKNYDTFCLVKFQLETGRTHQIRVHSKFIGHPILGDSLYGKTSEFIKRQALHAYKISFIHPISNKELIFETALPDDINKLI